MRVRIPPHTQFADVGSESVALNATTEKLHGLNPTAARMLKVLGEAGSVEAAHEVLKSEFDIDPEILRRDLVQLVDALCQRGILERIPDA